MGNWFSASSSSDPSITNDIVINGNLAHTEHYQLHYEAVTAAGITVGVFLVIIIIILYVFFQKKYCRQNSNIRALNVEAQVRHAAQIARDDAANAAREAARHAREAAHPIPMQMPMHMMPTMVPHPMPMPMPASMPAPPYSAKMNAANAPPMLGFN